MNHIKVYYKQAGKTVCAKVAADEVDEVFTYKDVIDFIRHSLGGYKGSVVCLAYDKGGI